MSLLTRLYRGETEFDIVGQRKRWFAISAALIVISLLGLGVRARLAVGVLAMVYTGLPGTAVLPLGTLVGAIVRFRSAAAAG